jgi:aldehyde dehydrogenase (NAD+)
VAIGEIQSAPVMARGDHLPGEIERIFRDQQRHWPSIRNSSAEIRIAKLNRLHDKLIEHRQEILDALRADLHKPVVESELSEIAFVSAEIKFAVKHLRRWMQPRAVKTPIALWGTRSEIRYEPKGVALIISPWNFPFTLTLGPLVGAIAAGCCVMIKPSEHAPNAARVMQTMLAEILPKREIAVIEGGPEVAQALLKLPFNHIYYTGSPEIGKVVMKAAAEHLVSVTLELGGKSPTIVDHTADVVTAARTIANAKYLNAGQMCIAPDYVLVQDRVYDRFVAAVRDHLHASYGSTVDAQQESNSYARLVNTRHLRRVQQLIDRAVADGAQIAAGGQADPDDRFIPPTVLTYVPLDTPVMQEEIFGPVLPIVAYQSLDDAINLINSKPNPLALYMFSQDEAAVDRVLGKTTAGASCVNDVALQLLNPELPFGGAGWSGIGKGYHHWGFLAFSNERPVVRRVRSSPLLKLIGPPYSALAERLLRLLTR